jgi:hypothetical protein
MSEAEAPKYHLKDLVEDHELFEKAVEEYAQQIIDSYNKPREVVNINADELAEYAYSQLQVQLGSGGNTSYDTKLLPFVKDRFLQEFARDVREWQNDRLIKDFRDMLYDRGEQYTLVVDPPRSEHGDHFDQTAVEIVLLDPNTSDDSTLAYRYATTEGAEAWTLGTIQDAVTLCLERRTRA